MRLFTAPAGCTSPPSLPPSAGPRRPVLRWTTWHWPRTLMPVSEVRDTWQHPPDTNFGSKGHQNRRHERGGALFLRSARVTGADMTETTAPAGERPLFD